MGEMGMGKHTNEQPADGVEARTYWMRPEQLDGLKKKFHGGAVGLFVADVQTDLYSVPVHVGTLAASKADSAQPHGWVLHTGHGDAYHHGAEPPKSELPDAWRPVYATPQPEGGRGEAVLTKHGERAIGRCIKELEHLITLASDYDFDEQTIATFETAIESMKLRLATPADAARVRDAEDARRYRKLQELYADLKTSRSQMILEAFGIPVNAETIVQLDAALAAVEGGQA